MSRRTQFQLGLLAVGLFVWGYGQRVDEPTLRWIGIGCFAVATILRFAARRSPPESGP